MDFKINFKQPFDVTLPRLPRKENDCPALPYCKFIGNGRGSCESGSITIAEGFNKCLASLVMILGSLAGITLEPPLPAKQIQGFSGQNPDPKDEGKGT